MSSHRASCPTVHVIPPGIFIPPALIPLRTSSHCACHPTGHLVPLCMLSHRASLSHYAPHPTVHVIPPGILSHCACHPSHRASYSTVHVIPLTGHLIPLCISSLPPGILSHCACHPSHRASSIMNNIYQELNVIHVHCDHVLYIDTLVFY